MFTDTFKHVQAAFSGPVAKQHVASLIRYHRIQASPGIREAARYCQATLQQAGIEAQIKYQPAEMASVIALFNGEKVGLVVLRYEGTLDKFIGDAVMVFFGDPQTLGEKKDALNCKILALIDTEIELEKYCNQ